jgi:hypothetical protein
MSMFPHTLPGSSKSGPGCELFLFLLVLLVLAMVLCASSATPIQKDALHLEGVFLFNLLVMA